MLLSFTIFTIFFQFFQTNFWFFNSNKWKTKNIWEVSTVNINLAHQDKQFYTHFTPYWDIFSKISKHFPKFSNTLQLITPPKLLRSGEYRVTIFYQAHSWIFQHWKKNIKIQLFCPKTKNTELWFSSFSIIEICALRLQKICWNLHVKIAKTGQFCFSKMPTPL